MNSGGVYRVYCLFGWRRPASLGIIVLFHILFIAYLISNNPDRVVPKPMVIRFIAIGNMPGPELAERQLRTRVPDRANNVAEFTSVSAETVSPTIDHMDRDTGPVSTGCAIAEMVGTAISQDPTALAQLASLPSEQRTSADAVVAWNGKWLLDANDLSIANPANNMNVTPKVHSPVWQAVDRAVGSASTACRAAPMKGPAFIAVHEAQRTTMLVVGSGDWRWDQLTLNDCDATAFEGCSNGGDPVK